MSGGGRRRAGSSWPSFSRFFAPRSPSRDEEEEKPAASQPLAGGTPSPENGPVTISQKTENAPSTEPVKISQSEDSRSHSEKSANLSPEEDSKKPDNFPSLPSDTKTVHNDKQPKEGFLQFLGSLFNISAKSPQQPTLKSEHDKTEKDSQNRIVLHEEEFKKESDMCSSCPLEEPNPATEEKDLPTSVGLSDGISQDKTGESEQESSGLLKKVEREPEVSAITYSTYRGPRQILKILKNQTKLETLTSVQRTDETSDSSADTQTGTGSESEAVISPDSPVKNTDLPKGPLKDAVLNNSNYKESILNRPSLLNRPSSSTETLSSSIVESGYNHPLNYVPVYKIDNDMIGSVLFGNDTKDPRNPAFQRIVNPKTTFENNFLKNDRASEQRGECFQPPSVVLSDLNVGLSSRESEIVKHECEDLSSASKTTLYGKLGLPESKCSVSYHFGSIVLHHQAEADTEHMNEENRTVIQDSQINMQVKENTKEKEISSPTGLLSSANILHARNEVVGSLLKDTDYSLTTKNFDSAPSDKVSQGTIIIQNDHPSIEFVNEAEKVDCVQNSITPGLKFEVNRNHISVSPFESENLELAKVLPGSSDVNNETTSPLLESEKPDFYDSAPTFDFKGGIFRKCETPILKNVSLPIEHKQDKIVHSTTLKEIDLVLPDFDSEEIFQAEISASDSEFKDKHLQATSQSNHRSQSEALLVLESSVAEDLLHGYDSKVIGSATYDENKISLGPYEPRDIDGTKIISDKSGIGLSSSDVLSKSQEDDGTLKFLGSDISVAKIISKLKAKSSLEVSSMLKAEGTTSFKRHYEKNNLLGDSSTSKPEEANMLTNSSKPKDNFEILKVTTELSHEDTSLVMMMSTNSSHWEFEKANQTGAEMTSCHRHDKDVPEIHMEKGGPNYLTAAVLKNAMEADAQTVASVTVSVNSSSQQCSEASAEDTETRKRAYDRPLNSNGDLAKTAERLVGIILDSVRQKIKSTHIRNNYQDCNAVTLKEEATGKRTSEEKEKTLIQLPDHECSVKDMSEDKREEKACVFTTVGEGNLLTDTDKMDMSNLLIIKARELVNEVIRGAQQKLIDGHYRKTKPRNHTRSTEKASATKILNNDIIKPHYIAKGFLPSEQPESQSITKLSENKESKSLLAKSNLNNDTDSTKGREIVPYQKNLYAGNGFEQSDSVELPKSDVLLSENISHKDLDYKGMPLTCNTEESEAQKAPSRIGSGGNRKTQTEDTGTVVINFKWPPFMNDEVYTHLPSTSKNSFSDSLVCINEKCLPGHSNKSLPITMLEIGKVYRKDAEFNIGKTEMAPPMLEMGKVYKKSTELNVGENELMPSVLEMVKTYKMDAKLNAGENELMPSVLEMGKAYGRSELNITKLEGTPDSFNMGKPFKRNTSEMTPVTIEIEKAFEKDIEGDVGKTTMISTELKMEKTHRDDIQLNITQDDSAKPTILEIANMNQKTVEGNIGESKEIPALIEVEKVYQMDTEENFGETEMRPIETKKSVVLYDSKAKSQFEGYELPTLSKDCEGNIGFMTPDFLPEDSKLRTEKNLCVTAVCGKERDLDYDFANEHSHLAFMPQDEQGNSSFTILYEEPLQDEGQYLSAKEGANSLVFPNESTNGLPHVLVCERSESRTDLVHHFEKENKSSEMFDSDSSEMFLSVEAKRYKVYPLALSPIYEDDSSQEDILSSEVSPGHRGSSAKSRDGASQPSSVLSLLQSVSERLRMNFDDREKLVSEEEVVDEDEEGPRHKEIILKTGKREHVTFQLPDCSIIYQGEDQEGTRSSKMPLFLSNEPTASNQQTVLWQDRSLLYHAPGPFLQKSDLSSKLHSSFKSVYNQYLQTTKTLLPEKGPKFGGNLQEPVPKLSTCPENPIDKQSLRSNPRPGKMVIYDLHGSKYKQEIYNNILDATSWTFPNGAFIRVVRGCWILYEKPHFQGHKCVLEEGEKVLNRDWIFRSKKHQTRNFVIGSIRRVLKDCSVPEIELCPQSDAACCPVYLQRSVANLEELNLPRSVSFAVKAGVWLAFPDVNFKGQVTVLEEGHGLFEISSSEMKSLHPLQMGGLKVEMPMNLRVIIYDKTHFFGKAKEFNEHVDSVPQLFRNDENFFGIASIRVIGGVWVAYEKEHFKGQQYLLEEGEYEDISTWETLNSTLLSFRYLQANFIESSITLFESEVENSKFINIINRDIPDLEEVGFGNETRSIHVKSGVWVGYQQQFFCGEQYILEKGKYKSFFDWGGSNNQILSIRPVRLEPLGINEPLYLTTGNPDETLPCYKGIKLKAYDQPNFQGNCVDFTDHISDMTDFIPHSFKVLRGCWLMHFQEDVTRNQCVLEEGLYADLTSCGCSPASIKSLKPIDYVFEEPFISLFALEHCEGRELHLGDAINSILNKDLYFYTQSVWVKSGLWIAYEGSNFLGRQILLEPREISNWSAFSGWKTIGSLRPIKQPSVYVRIKNRAQGEYLTVTGNLADLRTTSVCISPYNGKNTQMWYYCRGLFKSKANDTCLDVIGGKDVPGAKVAVWNEHGKLRQKWKMNKDGTISSYLNDQLVLDIKGGSYCDKTHIIINQPLEGEPTQQWDIEIL